MADTREEKRVAPKETVAPGVERVDPDQLRAVAEKIARRRAGLFERLSK